MKHINMHNPDHQPAWNYLKMCWRTQKQMDEAANGLRLGFELLIDHTVLSAFWDLLYHEFEVHRVLEYFE